MPAFGSESALPQGRGCHLAVSLLGSRFLCREAWIRLFIQSILIYSSDLNCLFLIKAQRMRVETALWMQRLVRGWSTRAFS